MNTVEQAKIREIIEDWVKAIRAKDVKSVMAQYAPDVLSFDLIQPLQQRGADAIRKRVEDWFSTYEGPIGYEMRDLAVSADEDIAFSTSLDTSSGTKKNGERAEMWMRMTMCYRKVAGQWRITHEHVSVPFDMQSFKALLDLKP